MESFSTRCVPVERRVSYWNDVASATLSLVAATYSSQIELPVGRGVKARARAYRAYIDSRLEESELTPADGAGLNAARRIFTTRI